MIYAGYKEQGDDFDLTNVLVLDVDKAREFGLIGKPLTVKEAHYSLLNGQRHLFSLVLEHGDKLYFLILGPQDAIRWGTSGVKDIVTLAETAVDLGGRKLDYIGIAESKSSS